MLVLTHMSTQGWRAADLLSDPSIAADEVLLLRPSGAGTSVEVGTEIGEVQALLDAGLPVREAIMPQTRLSKAERLAFLGRIDPSRILIEMEIALKK